jgi:preprotein translocase subunit SecD
MERSWQIRAGMMAALTVVAAYLSLPSFIYVTSDPKTRRDKGALAAAMPEFAKDDLRVNLGIDLQGGLHLVMGVDTAKAVLNRTDRLGDELADAMKEKGKPVISVRRDGDSPTLVVELKDTADMAELQKLAEDRRDVWQIKGAGGTRMELVMIPEVAKRLGDDAVGQAIKTLRNRIDPTGTKEPELRKRGDNSILIQIAGLTADEEKVVKSDVIGRVAQLEFKIVDDESRYFSDVAAQAPEAIKLSVDSYRGPGDSIVSSPFLYSPSREALEGFVTANPPPSDRVVSYAKMPGENGQPEQWRTYLLDRKTPLTGDSIVNATPFFDSDQAQWSVSLRLDRAGGQIFGALTAANIRKRVAIVLDNVVDSAPVIQSAIPNGQVSITLGGVRTQDEILKEAEALSAVLNAGALPAPVGVQEERTVGATLGDDAIAKGKNALFASAIVTILVMIGVYRLSGAIAILAMAINMLFLVAVLSLVRASISLPGLAGLALTIGMAVDANIVQFERIREELRHGKTLRTAVDAGFDNAFRAIFDSNATSALAAVVLMQYGSGPIRGFAFTLLVGVVINTFTSVIVPRLCLDYLVKGKKAETLSI